MLRSILATDPHALVTLAIWFGEFALSVLVLVIAAVKMIGGLIAILVDEFHHCRLEPVTPGSAEPPPRVPANIISLELPAFPRSRTLEVRRF
jgi:hypothetical protein